MSEGVRGVLVAHGQLADGLVGAVEEITGETGGIRAVAVRGLTPEALEERLESLAGDGPSIVFVDLPSGSCAYAARRLQRRHPGMAVVCGVNLPLLLDFIFHRSDPLTAVVDRLRSHVGVSIEFEGHDDRAVSD